MRYLLCVALLVCIVSPGFAGEPQIARVSLSAPKDGGSVDTASLNRVVRDIYERLGRINSTKADSSSLVRDRYVGEVRLFANATLPDGWIDCDGASLLRADYADLFAEIGTDYGSADSTHFNVPNMLGRVPVGAGSGSGLTARSRGDSGGEETHTLTVTEMPAHSHVDRYLNSTTGSSVGYASPNGSLSGLFSTYSTGGDGAHNNMQPYAVVRFAICYSVAQ